MELHLPVMPERLTRTEQKILEFIHTNTDSFLFLSIGQLSKQLDISDATLSRFARHVGCRDFKALKALVLEQAAAGPAVKLAGTLHQEQGFSPEGWLTRQAQYLAKTAEQLDSGEFRRGVEALAAARRILIFGKNASASLAQLLFFRLRRLGLSVVLLPAGSELLEGLNQAGTGDLIVLFGFSKLSREGKVLLEYGRSAGCRTMAFVGRTCLPAEEMADINLYAYRGTEKEYHSMTAPVALLDALVVELTRTLGNRGAQALETIQKLKKEYYL